MRRSGGFERKGRGTLPGPSPARFVAGYGAVGIVLMVAAFALSAQVEPVLGPGLAPFAPAVSVGLVFGAAFLLLRFWRRRREAAAPPGLPLTEFLAGGGVIGPNLDEAGRARALAALTGLARRQDVLAIEIDPDSVDAKAADAVTILTTAPDHLLASWETRLGAEAVESAPAPGGAQRRRFVWD